MNPELLGLHFMFAEETNAARNSTLSEDDLANDNVNLTPATREQVEQIIDRLFDEYPADTNEEIRQSYRNRLNTKPGFPLDLLEEAVERVVPLHPYWYAPLIRDFLFTIESELHHRRFVQERAERALGETK